MEIIIVFVVIIILGAALTRNKDGLSSARRNKEDSPSANVSQADDRSGPEQGPRAAFEHMFSGYTETDRYDAVRMCQKRMDVTHEDAMNCLARKPELFAEMLAHAEMEAETKRLD